MWFLGLVIGAIIGAVGGAQGAILGGLFGAGVGWVISQKPSVPSDSRLRTIESSIKLLQQRVAGLEKTIQAQQSTGLAPMNVSSAAEFPEPSASERRDAPPAESYVPPRPPPLDTDNSLPPHEVSAPDTIESGHVPPAAPPPLRAAQPSPIWNFFFGGNTLVRFGVIVVIFRCRFPAQVRFRTHRHSDRGAVYRCRDRRHRHVGDRLALARFPSRLWFDYARRRDWSAVSHGVCRL